MVNLKDVFFIRPAQCLHFITKRKKMPKAGALSVNAQGNLTRSLITNPDENPPSLFKLRKGNDFSANSNSRKIYCGGSRNRTYIFGFGDRSPTTERCPHYILKHQADASPAPTGASEVGSLTPLGVGAELCPQW